MEKDVEEVDPSKDVEESAALSHGKATFGGASSSGSKSWIRSQDPRIVRVSRAFGGKDRHSKVFTIKGLRDRRVRLSVPTATQLYDLQDRLGLSQPSKVVDWLLDAAKHEIDELPPLPMVPVATNLVQYSIHHPRISAASGGSAAERGSNVEPTMEHGDERRRHDSTKGSGEPRLQERNGRIPDYPLGSWSDALKRPRSYNVSIPEVVLGSQEAAASTQTLFPSSISAIAREDEGMQPRMDQFPISR